VGGPVATILAARWGARVRGLVVASCSLVRDPPVPPPFRLLWVPLLGPALERLLFSAPALRLLAWMATSGPAPWRNTPHEVESIRRMFATALKSMAAHFAPVEEAVSRVTAPVHFVVGERDPFFTVPFARRMAGLFSRGRLVTLRGVAHFPQLEAPQAFAATVAEAAGGSLSQES
jgi:pimeloyl-ACP methyl ester carboxylesterase